MAFFIPGQKHADAMLKDLLQLENELDEFVYDYGFQLVDLQVGGIGRGRIFRVFLERVDGERIVVGDCSALAPQIRMFLEMKQVYNDKSSLEVSSAGLDRVLKKDRDFERYLGHEVKVRFVDGAQKATITGELASFTDEVLVISLTGAQGDVKSQTVQRRNLEKVRLVPQLEF